MAHNSSGKTTVSLASFNGLAPFSDPDSLPSGASPRCHDVTFSVGGFRSRDGLANAYAFASLSVQKPGTSAISSTWANPSNALGTSAYATASGLASGTIDITGFGFAAATAITGIEVFFDAQCGVPAEFTAQLVQNGEAIGDPITVSELGSVALGGQIYSWECSPNVNLPSFGVRIWASSANALASYSLNNVRIAVYLTESLANFQYVKSFAQTNGALSNLALDADGTLWVEDAINDPGILSALVTGIAAGSYAKSTTADDREYIAFNNLAAGSDVPIQYTGQWTDRITQEGPGAPPVFTPQTYSGDDYAIATISQPAQQSWGYAYFLQSSGPGVTTAGNVVTVYYADSTSSGPDLDLQAAWNSGYGVNIYVSFAGSGVPSQGPYTQQVTSIGLAQPPGQPRKFYYFTYVLPTSAAQYYQGSGNPSFTATYQRTLATLDSSVPVPGLVPGNQITITGSSVASYNSQWTITQNLNSGSVGITQTQVASGVATFSYALQSGIAPSAGQLITITGTTNADGALNGASLTIATASGGETGTFTVLVSVPDAAAAAEQGLGVTAGTEFAFDPGAALVGTTTNPIYGNATGGELVFVGTQQFIYPGIRQGVVFFGTRNGAETPCSTPVVFTVPSNVSTIVASQIPIGPPNTAYRQVSITEAGQLGQPGGNFYTIDDPVTYTVNGINYVSTSFRINDNTTTQLAMTFRDSDLLSARPIDQQGGDLFDQIQIGNPAWIVQYAGRMVYGLTLTRVENFVNLTFAGGYNPSPSPQPLGWTIAGSGGSLAASPAFGNSYYIANATSSTQASLGLLTQSAYRDYYGTAILMPNTAYSVRVTARCPSGLATGNLVVSLTNGTQTMGSVVIPFASLGANYSTTVAAIFPSTATIPSALLLTVQATAVGAGADVDVASLDLFPTLTPVNANRLLVSYVEDPEGVDGVTGAVATDAENAQPCMGAVVMYDLLYLLKTGSMCYTQDSSGDEPDQWGVHEVSNKAGACGVNAYDSGEEWIAMANRNGVYVFTGGEPQKISQEIQPIWDSINWTAGNSIWLRNDVQERRMCVGVPLPTPCFWLPDAPANPAPAFPNVWLVCDYQGQNSGSSVQDADPLSSTFYGDLLAEDMRRKWTIWQIPSPYADFVSTKEQLSAPLLIGNGQSNSKLYRMSGVNDDGAEIPWRYVTYGFGGTGDSKKYPALGDGLKRWAMWKARIVGSGTALVNMFQEKLDSFVSSYNSYSVALDSQGDLRGSACNAVGYLVFFDIESGGLNSSIQVSTVLMVGMKDVHSADFVRS